MDHEHDDYAWWPADVGSWPDEADEPLRRMAQLLGVGHPVSTAPTAAPTAARSPSLSFTALKRLSFTHSTIYVCLLAVWLIPGLAAGETVFGFAHGFGWICMVLLILLALRARVVPLRTAFAVSVLGGIAPSSGAGTSCARAAAARQPVNVLMHPPT